MNMNRRKFVSSGIMGFAALSVFPSYALAKPSSINLSNLGGGFQGLSDKLNSIPVSKLPKEIKKTYLNLVTELKASNYIYDANSIVQLNERIYSQPLLKKSFLGLETKEIAILDIKNNNFFILDEKMTEELDCLITNFSYNMKSHDIDIDAGDFSFPAEVLSQTKGKVNTFVYKNKFNKTITLSSDNKKAKAFTC